MLGFIRRIRVIKNLILNKLDHILENQNEYDSSLRRMSRQLVKIETLQSLIFDLSKDREQSLDKIQDHLLLIQPNHPTLIQQQSIASDVDTHPKDPTLYFQADLYQRINQRRLEHLASLSLPIAKASVLEVGAGIGDHTSFFLDRHCSVVVTEARPENVDIIRTRYPALKVRQLDIDNPDPNFTLKFDIVYCYGLLYHLRLPAEALAFMAARAEKLLLLETCVSFGEEPAINHCEEPVSNPTQSFSGTGCRPTRSWIYAQLKQHFPFVYLPVTQPNHEQFPLVWDTKQAQKDQWDLARAIFIASYEPIANPLLIEELPTVQLRHYLFSVSLGSSSLALASCVSCHCRCAAKTQGKRISNPMDNEGLGNQEEEKKIKRRACKNHS
jgi:hypothetical protein